MNILELSFEELVGQMQHRFGKGAFHAAAVYRQVFTCGSKDFRRLSAFSQSPALAWSLEEVLELDPAPISDIQREGDVLKFVSRLNDGENIESVLIPMANHMALCISSQVGCRMGCRFCQTGQMGLRRNLTAAEIVGQVFRARFTLKTPIRNLVLMGMGEPLDNFDAVARALAVITDQRGLNIAPKHITISTVGWLAGLEKLAGLKLPQLKLAVSLSAADDTLRSRLMPVNQKYPLADLKKALLAYPLQKDGTFFIEYVLIKGINDSRCHARQLAEYLSGLKVKVNLIGYNPRCNSPYEAPRAEDLLRFRDDLIECGVFVRLRASKGRRIMAACGQLGAVAGV